MRFVVDVTYKENGAELTPVDARMVRAMLERATGQVLFHNAILTWSYPEPKTVEELAGAMEAELRERFMKMNARSASFLKQVSIACAVVASKA